VSAVPLTTRAAAVAMIRAGSYVVPIPARSKNPGFPGWEKTKLTEADVPARFAEDGNLGVILGIGPRFDQDVDLDCLEALRLADAFLPATEREHGRKSAPRSHRWYTVDEPGSVVRLKDPEGEKETIVELRGAGGQTVAPPSIHPEGERLTWEKDGEPAVVPLAALRASVSRLAAACLIARRYPEKNRHDFTNALAGFLLRRGMPTPDVEALLLAVARSISGAARTEDVVHIKRNVADTAKKVEAGKPATGGRALADFLSPKTMDKLTEWLGLTEPALTEPGEHDEGTRRPVLAAPDAGAEIAVESSVAEEPQFPAPPAPEAFHGLVGEFVRLVGPHTEADPVALLGHFLVYFGNAVGRGPFFRIGTGGRHHANEYVALVGLTGAGRKGTAENEARHPFILTGDPWTSRIISGLSSGEGLISAVRDAVREQKSVREKNGSTRMENVVSDAGVEDKRVCFRESELGRVLRIMDRDGNTLSATIRQLWDGEDVLQTITKNSPTVATGAHGSIVGHVTAEELRRELDRVEVANGFGNRFIWLAVKRTKFLPDGGSLRDADLYQLVEKLRDALDRARAVREMQRSAEASKAWHIVYEPLDSPRPGLSGAMTARAAPHVLRLSMIYALLDGSATIGLPHLDAALALWTYAEDSVRFLFGDATGDLEADTILSALRRTERLSRNDIYNDLFHRHATAPRIEAALGLLKRHGLAHMTTEATGGRPAEFWRAGRAEATS
jgi:Bifunctional DNA primase/polymerase, N-terminal/Protein of unknown function (DUF3987)